VTLVASLGMYDHPAQRAANDALWHGLAHELRSAGIPGVPDDLDRSRSVEAIWHDPRLLFAQACGYPLTAPDAPAVRLVALPVYDVPGCDGATHRSVIVVRAADRIDAVTSLRGSRVAINAPTSNTGMNLLRAVVAPLADGAAFSSDVVVTGGHRASAEAIVRNDADGAAIDCVTWAALRRHEPALTGRLRVIATTGATTALPFVTAAARSDAHLAAIRTALAVVVADPALTTARDALFLRDIVPADEGSLAPVRSTKREATALGYPTLR
jgi:ABC-type phosphate/phosphonate transport system substrate-binding protein